MWYHKNMDGIILVRKPQGITSHDLVQHVRRILNTKKIGHTGTLDPLASGLMMLTIGKCTKLLPFIVEHSKEYIAELELGYSTDTQDCTGEVKERKDIVPFTKEDVLRVFTDMTGPQLQVPPMYSSKKVNGQKLYDLARKNIEIEREAVPIEISELELMDLNSNIIRFRVRCSAGTYVRVLCSDIAFKLGNLGVMKSLVRTAIDTYRIEEAFDEDDLRNGNYKLLTAYDVLKKYRYIEAENVDDIKNGKNIILDCSEDTVIITHGDEVLAAYERDRDNIFICRRGLW